MNMEKMKEALEHLSNVFKDGQITISDMPEMIAAIKDVLDSFRK